MNIQQILLRPVEESKAYQEKSVGELAEEELSWTPKEGSNSIIFIYWHLIRVEDMVINTTAPSGFSYSLNAPERWYARWAVRFYTPTTLELNEPTIDQVLFVSIHFASDQKVSLPTDMDEPVVSAGRLKYKKPMTAKTASKNYDYYMCKYWFFGEPHPELEGWRRTMGSQFSENLEGSETFVVPLYDVTSSEKLRELVIDPLLTFVEKQEKKEV